jgi:2-dehydropantoate 2-reductase
MMAVHVLILGAGALGSLLGARLLASDAKVTLLSTNRDHIRSIRDHGLTIEELDGSIERVSFSSVFDDPRDLPEAADVVLLLVKSYATRQALQSIRNWRRADTLVLTLQNGIGNWERIAAEVGSASVLVGTTAQGSTLVGPGRVRHGGNGPTYLGEKQGALSERVQSLVELFTKAGLETYASGEMDRLIWKKLLVNVGINAITALTGIRNGVVASLEVARELCQAAVEEAVAVAQARGQQVPPDMVQQVWAIARATARNRSSMGQDVDRRKRTEIDAINGAIVQFGREDNVPTPVNRTLTQLIKILEASLDEKSEDRSQNNTGM